MPRFKKLGLAAALTLGIAAAPSEALALQAEYAPIVVKPNKDTFLRFIVWNQIWSRLIENNPGSETEWTPDVGVRRARFLAFGKIGDDVLIMFHFGINNQTFLQNEFGTNGGPNFFVHDAWTEFNLVKSSAFRLDFGGGLLYWNGISRMTNASTLNFLAIDAPITNWATINGTDQFARQLGLYVKGDAASKLIDYRIALVRPFSSGRFGATPTDTFGLSWYLKAQFLDKESNTLPYAVGTYLGAKTVFNIGTGGHWQPNAGAPAGTDETGENGDILLLGFDAFADLPLGDKGAAGAVTAYLVGYIFDYGEGDVAPVNTGIMRIPSGGTPTSLNGTGNGYALFGDGFSAYGQVGYLLPGDPDGLRIQPYVTAQLNAWSAYDDIAPVLEVGSNFYLEGHHAKFTLNYRARPIMTANETSFGAFDGFASEFILQTMIFL